MNAQFTPKAIRERVTLDRNQRFVRALPSHDIDITHLLRVNEAMAAALAALLKETEEAGNANADDYGWPTVVPQARAALALHRGETL